MVATLNAPNLPTHMQAMVFHGPGQPLQLEKLAVPTPQPGQVLVKVLACGVCRTDLHVFDGELPNPTLPLILGHEVVGTVVNQGSSLHDEPTLAPQSLVGIPWLAWTCNNCPACLSGQENLCPNARFTGYTTNGGFAEYALADARYVLPLPTPWAGLDEVSRMAPLLCAGLIGYRSYRLAGLDKPSDQRQHILVARRLGLYGFGAAAHILAQLAQSEQQEVYAFVRPSDEPAMDFARKLGAVWAGPSTQLPPHPLDAALIFAPAGELVPMALAAVRHGGIVVCGGIHMSDIPSFPYELLWHEKTLRSVANLTREDGFLFVNKLRHTAVQTTVHTYPLAQANQALDDLRRGALHGAAVLLP